YWKGAGDGVGTGDGVGVSRGVEADSAAIKDGEARSDHSDHWTNLLAFGDRMLWADYVALWSKTTGVPATFEKTTVAEHAKLSRNGYGEQVGEMYAYFQDFGYDGSDPSVVHVQH
ncbi:hypothetical protein B0A49_13747, partial [Cryomyces minteri]